MTGSLDNRDGLKATPEVVRELCDCLATSPEYAADTTFAAIWNWLARKEAALAKARGEQP